jgi:hypothetical protein
VYLKKPYQLYSASGTSQLWPKIPRKLQLNFVTFVYELDFFSANQLFAIIPYDMGESFVNQEAELEFFKKLWGIGTK